MRQALERWKENPWWGTGVTRLIDGPDVSRLAPAATTSIWTELLSEKGLIGTICSLGLIGLLVLNAAKDSGTFRWTQLATHIGVNWLFVQTLPRLDFWLIIFMLGFKQNLAQTHERIAQQRK